MTDKRDRIVALLNGLNITMMFGLRQWDGMTEPAMRRMAGELTGKKYGPREPHLAIADLQRLIEGNPTTH